MFGLGDKKKETKDDMFLNKLGPGESTAMSLIGYMDKDTFEKAYIGKFVINYSDKFGNEYQNEAIIDLKKRKIIKQEYKIVKKVKDLGYIPKLEINENSIDWGMVIKKKQKYICMKFGSTNQK